MSKLHLDISDFEHIKSDKDKTTLKSKRFGHTVTVAHNSIHPDTRKVFERLAELGNEPEKKAEGGQIDKMSPSNGLSPTKKEPGYTKMAHGGHPSMSDIEHGAPSDPYSAGLPCLNPHCKSHGQPHPNCRCYSGGERFAKGGEVRTACAEGMPHEPGCEYYKGGDVDGGIPGPTTHGVGTHLENAMHTILDWAKDKGEAHAKALAPQTEAVTGQNPYSQEAPQQEKSAAPQPGQIPPAIAASPSDQNETQSDSQPNISSGPSSIARDPSIQSEQPQAEATAAPVAQQPQAQAPVQQNEPMSQEASNILSQSHPSATTDYNDMASEYKKLEHDLATNVINPTTYEDLFARKDTSGKIGTLFGLMLGGVGSGLTHQPNAVMEMMYKEVQNDIEAQKQNVENKRSLLSLSYQHELQQAQARGLDASSALTRQEAATKALALSQIRGNIIEFNKLAKMADTLPESDPRKQTAANALMMLKSQMDASNSSVAARAAAANATLRFGQQGGAGGYASPGLQKAAAVSGDPTMQNMAKYGLEHNVPNVGEFSRPVDDKGRDAMMGHQMLGATIKDLKNNFGKYSKLVNSKFDPNTAAGKIEIRNLQTKIRESMLNTVYREGEQPLLDEFVHMPPTSLLNYLEKGKLDALDKINNRDYSILKNKYGPVGQPSQEQSSQRTAPVQTSKSGREIIYKNGKPFYK